MVRDQTPLADHLSLPKRHRNWREGRVEVRSASMMRFLILFLHVLVSPFKTQAQLEAEILLSISWMCYASA